MPGEAQGASQDAEIERKQKLKGWMEGGKAWERRGGEKCSRLPPSQVSEWWENGP